jgi:glycosyltransferase involved in cell wall biosynthesis
VPNHASSGENSSGTVARVILKAIFWASAAGLAWTHVGYPVAAAALRRVRERPVRKEEIEPTVSLIVPAHDEEDVIEARVQNLLELDYPAEKLELVVASDASTDRTHELVRAYDRVRLLECERAGKLPTMNRAVRETDSEILAFGDANAVWAPDALHKLVRNFADPDVAYVCGQVRFQREDGTNKEGLYWRYELWLRESESALGSITGGNGAIYAVRRSDYVEWPFGHDQGFPNLMVQKGRRAVYEPEALAFEKPSTHSEDEFRRKVRMLPWSWRYLFEAGPLRGVPPMYLFELLSHRVLRYASGFLHVGLLATSIALVGEGWIYQAALALQALWLVLAVAGKLRLRVPGAGIAWYYLLMTAATMAALVRYLREGAPLMWEKAEGTR